MVNGVLSKNNSCSALQVQRVPNCIRCLCGAYTHVVLGFWVEEEKGPKKDDHGGSDHVSRIASL
jgi:hypothetical protein